MKQLLFILIALGLFACNENTKEKPVKKQEKSSYKFDNKPFKLSAKFKAEKDTSVTFLWTEKIWDHELQDTIESIHINEKYAKSASPEAKIVLAYISTLAGSDCWWKGEQPNNDQSNLECAILSALSMGFQCSKEHLGPIRKAFAHDSVTLINLQNCAAVPYTATYQNAVTNISIQKKGSQYKVIVNALFLNSRKQSAKEWASLLIFDVSENGIKISKEIDYSNN